MEKKGDRLVWLQHPEALITTQKHKMSKSRGNVVNPDDVVYRYGADSLRLYEMFLGPLQDTKVCILHNSCACVLPGRSFVLFLSVNATAQCLCLFRVFAACPLWFLDLHSLVGTKSGI